MGTYLFAKRNLVEELLPSDAFSATFNSGVSSAWGAWSQVTASTSFEYVLCGLHFYNQFIILAQGNQFPTNTIQVGTGASSSEVAIAQGSVGQVVIPGGTGQLVITIFGLTMPFEPVVIPAGTRVAIRAYGDQAAALQCAAYLYGYDARDYEKENKLIRPDRYLKGLYSPTQGSFTYPSTGYTNVTSGSPAWAYGSWVEFIAAASNNMLITGVASYFLRVSNAANAKVGVGGAGSEVVGGRVGLTGRTYGGIGTYYLPRPVFVKKGERVAVQVAAATASLAHPIILLGYELK